MKTSLGVVPDMVRLIATSPAALEGYLGLNGALAKGELPAATRERIALAVAAVNGCTSCNSAHSSIGKTMLKLDEAEIAASRAGRFNDPKAEAALRFASKVAVSCGAVAEDDLRAVRMASQSDAQRVEIVLHVALDVLTDDVNEVFATEVDFPVIAAQRPA